MTGAAWSQLLPSNQPGAPSDDRRWGDATGSAGAGAGAGDVRLLPVVSLVSVDNSACIMALRAFVTERWRCGQIGRRASPATGPCFLTVTGACVAAGESQLPSPPPLPPPRSRPVVPSILWGSVAPCPAAPGALSAAGRLPVAPSSVWPCRRPLFGRGRLLDAPRPLQKQSDAPLSLAINRGRRTDGDIP